ncbi:helix-turn-helix domain-containing protein [Treponema brennaborense]|uniref:Helix-turn-helix domain protein n=1 Tax=Treponema brennaborense (strain DSM 12168 / CIP 105900 / DD5/3) TaxID=906968 RepID=F4LIX8_TREBD|nr:helix-turn-helix transcriptional regulator [Treponema brennaborense]AEE17287.1 helix-turn-helix domain protein [Treponema brennaborense DSM 12168]
MEKLKIIVGDNIRRLRREYGWTQAYVAENLGVTAPFLTMIESGQRGMSLDLIEKLSELFDVPAASFFVQYSDTSAGVSRQELAALKKRLTLKMIKVIEETLSETNT